MSKVICVANTAGGVGKTTTAHALAASFVDYGKSVLLIDLDPKGDLTFRVGRDGDRTLIADYLAGMPISLDAFEKTAERFTFIATDSRINNVSLPETLSEFLVKLSNNFDVVVLDPPSTISPSLALALKAADLILIPTRDTLHSIRGAYEVSALCQGKKVYALAIGDFNTKAFDIEIIDCSILLGDEVELSEEGSNSVVTAYKDSKVAETYRDAAYSILEILGLD